MTWATGIMVFVVVWWLAWFCVLPLRIEIPDHVPTGQAASAPVNPRLAWKAGLATVIAALLWGGIWWLIAYDPLGLDLMGSR